MKRLIIFGTYHDVQGVEGFRRNIDDPDYKTLLEELMQLYDVNFIFEEASALGPSVASAMATVSVGYLDMDFENTDEALFPEPPEAMFCPKISGKPKLQQTAWKVSLTVQNSRESRWVSHIKDQNFETGLVICGLVHSLSVALRLQTEGFDVHVYTYEPIMKLCLSYGMPRPAKSAVDDVADGP